MNSTELLRVSETILDMSVSDLATDIKNKQISSVEATMTYINHIKAINPTIQCMVEDRFSEAMLEAKHCDQQLKEGKHTGRLFGVPISVKESLDVEGMKTTGGLKHRKNYMAKRDAEVVRRLKNEGAIVLCKTNTSTACLTFESNNKVYGRTNNPWDYTTTSGGSSGGEAALIASGGAAAGIGSDLAGSLRLPGHFNGVVSMKATEKSIPLSGHFPEPIHQLQKGMLSLGPITKTVGDAELMYRVMNEKKIPSIHPDTFHVCVPEIPNKYPMSDDTVFILQKVRNHFYDSALKEGKVPEFIWKLPLLHLKILMINGAKDMYPQLFGEEKFPLVQTMMQERTHHNTNYDYPFLKTLFLAKYGSALFRIKKDSNAMDKIQETVWMWKREMNQLLDNTVFIVPVFPKVTDRHTEISKVALSNRFLYRKWMPFTILPNVLDLPALSVPLYRDEDGLPISLQLIGKEGAEEALFHFGRELENTFSVYERAPMPP